MNAIVKFPVANKYGLVMEFFVARLVFLTASVSIVYAGYRMFLL